MGRITVHYHRPDGAYRGWALWVWEHPTGTNARAVPGTSFDDFGEVFVVETGAAASVGLLPFHGEGSLYDRPDRFWTPELGAELWVKSGVAAVFRREPSTFPRLLHAFIDSRTGITAVVEHPIPEEKLLPGVFALVDPAGNRLPVLKVSAEAVTGAEVADERSCLAVATGCQLPHREREAARWRLRLAEASEVPLLVRDILLTFSTADELGARVEGGHTRFAVFSPGATGIAAAVFAAPTGPPDKTIPLECSPHGVWRAEVPQDLTGKYYAYQVAGGDPEFGSERIAVDPYARSNTRHDGRSLIFGERKPLPEGPRFAPEEAVVYEVNLRDFTIDPDSGVTARGKYRGLAEAGTRCAGLATGLDHLAELGVNVIQLMPVCDFPNDEDNGTYDWGYMPAHFFCPDGWFATCTWGPERVDELRELVQILHARGFKVVFDVVYNHTCETEPKRVLGWGALAPRYYYRHQRDGTPWNGSGCGNEFRTEAPMARRMILDSLRYFVKAFGADGFRFDLLALIDEEGLRQIASELKRLKPDILLYGEPWAAGKTGVPLLGRRALAQLGYGFFADDFRDALRGSVFTSEAGFLATGGHIDALKRAIRGKDCAPLSRILYLECHDNHTLWDRLEMVTRGDATATPEDRKAMVRLGSVLLLTSPGVPFLHAGQEFLRSKNGADNSYNLPDAVNMVRWRRKKENYDVYRYIRGLIELRRTHGILKLRHAAERDASLLFLDDDLGLPVPDRAVGYLLRRGNRRDAFNEMLVLANASPVAQTFVLPAKTWEVLVDPLQAGPDAFQTHKGTEVTLPGRSAWVMAR
jgi:pullulanase